MNARRFPCRLVAVAALGLTACARPAFVTIPAAQGVPAIPATGSFRAGFGRVDITPPVGLGLLGWGPEGKRAMGWRQRLYARALVLEDAEGQRLALVALDLAHVSRLLVHRVAERTDTLGLGVGRLLVSATHTHSAPGHFHGHVGYDDYGSAVYGYDASVVEFLADGIAQSVARAAARLQPARAAWGADSLWGCTRVRSFVAFRENPPRELPFPDPEKIGCDRSEDEEERSIDPTITVLRVDAAEGAGRLLGTYVVAPVHGTVFSSANELYDADIHGAIARRVERWAHESAGADTGFVAVVANGASGDVAPDLPVDRRCRPPAIEPDPRPLGPRSPRPAYIWWRSESDEAFDLCRWLDRDNLSRLGTGMAGATAAILDRLGVAPDESAGWRLATAFAEIGFEEACADPLPGGPLAVGAEGGRTRYVPRGKHVERPGDLAPSRWKVFGLFDLGFDTLYARPRPERNDCHFPKHRGLGGVARVIAGPDALPLTAPLLVARAGSWTLLALPFEVTTTSGLRIRDSVVARTRDPRVTLVAPAIGYNSYLATGEEYGLQAYEGASTLYGPATQAVVARQTAELVARLEAGAGDSVPPLSIRLGRSRDRIPPGAASAARGEPRLREVRWETDTARVPELDQTRTEHTLRVEWEGADPKGYAPGGRPTVAVERVRGGAGGTLAWDDDPEVEVRSLGGRRWEARWRPGEPVEGECRVRVFADVPQQDAVSEPVPCADRD